MKTLFTSIILLLICTLKASADNYDSNNYLPENSNVQLNETNLPIVFIDTKYANNSTTIIHKDWRVAARMKIIDNENGTNYGDTLAYPNQKVDYEGWIAIRYRGNSSFTESQKKPFSIKTMVSSNPEGKKEKVSIMGMPKDNDWVLIAPFADRSMIRDVLMFELERPWLDYSPKARHCEVILDGIYYGVYIMSERPKKSKNRLNLDDPGDTGDELTGGYHLQIDRLDEHIFKSKYPAVNQYGVPYKSFNSIYFQYEHPEYDEMIPNHEGQLDYIQKQITLMEDVLANDNFTDSETGYCKYLDVTSFIDYMLAEEFSANVDGYRLSTHIYKHRDSVDPRFKLTIWDFNIALGNANYYDGERTNTWHYQNKWQYDTDAYNKIPFWWVRLMEDPEFVTQLKQRWGQYRQSNFKYEKIMNTVDSIVTVLDAKSARERNYTAFPVWGKKIWPVPNYQTVNTWEKEIKYLKEWITERIAWLDEQLDYNNISVGIDNHITGYNKKIACYYDMQGRRMEVPKKGFVIIKYQDGSTNKVLIK